MWRLSNLFANHKSFFPKTTSKRRQKLRQKKHVECLECLQWKIRPGDWKKTHKAHFDSSFFSYISLESKLDENVRKCLRECVLHWDTHQQYSYNKKRLIKISGHEGATILNFKCSSGCLMCSCRQIFSVFGMEQSFAWWALPGQNNHKKWTKINGNLQKKTGRCD